MGGQLPQIFLFFIFFYGFAISLFFSHHYSLGAFFVISSYVGPCQGDLFIRPIFSLAHFHALSCSLGVFSLCFFISLTNNIHILCLAHVVSLAFDHFDF
jgi:hypothetical protein